MVNADDATGATGLERSRPLLAALRRFAFTTVAVGIIGALTGLFIAQVQPVRYETSAEVLLTDPREAGVFRDNQPAGNPGRFVANQALRFRSSTVAVRAAALLDGAIDPAEVRDRVTTETAQDLDLVVLRTWGRTGQEAALLANAVVEAYEAVVTEELQASAEASSVEVIDAIDEIEERLAQVEAGLVAAPSSASLEGERSALVTQLVTLQGLQERLGVDVALYGSGVEVMEPASVPEEPVSPRPLANAVIGALLGLLAAGWFAVRKSESARRVENRHEPAAILQAPFLGDVPEFSARSDAALGVLDPGTAESYRFIAAALDYTLDGQQGATMLVTSAHPGDGKTTTSINLALALLGAGRRVALVDVDARVAGLTERTGLKDHPGLADLRPEVDGGARSVHQLQAPDGQWLSVTPIGQEQLKPSEYFRTPLYREALAALRYEHDIVLLDAPPLLSVAETSAAAGAVDGIILVVSYGTPVKALDDLRDRLQFIGAPLLGYVFNRGRGSSSPYGRYGYGSSAQGEPVAANGRSASSGRRGASPIGGSPTTPSGRTR